MQCKHASQLMSARLDGRLDSTERALLEDHVATCGTCQAEWRKMQRLDQLLGAAPMVEPPVRLRVQVMARLSRRDQARRAVAGGTALILGTVALALLLVAPTLIALVSVSGFAPALASGGPATIAQLLTFLRATGRALLVVLEQFAAPLAFLIVCGLVLTVTLNSLWIDAVRHVRASSRA
jgi:anti-sigma factor RsiW